MRAFQDEGLKNLFDEFVTAGNKVRKLTAVEKAIGDDDILWAAVDLAAGIKKRALELSQFNIK